MASNSQTLKTPALPRGLWRTVFKRELSHFLQTPGTYVALAFFLLLSGAIFVSIVSDFVDASTTSHAGILAARDAMPINVTERVIIVLFKLLNFLMLLIIPMLTMRLLAEEKQSGSFELLVSTPLGNWDILLGKYFATLVIGVLMLIASFLYPLLCAFYSQPEWSVIFSGYIGLFCIIASYIAFGLFASSLTDSQIGAGVIAFTGLLIFHMLDEVFKAGKIGEIATALSIASHSKNFTEGVVASGDITFFILFIVFFLFMTAQILDARRWRA